MLKKKNDKDEPKVVVLLTTFKDPPLLADILKSISQTKYSNFELVVDCNSKKVHQLLKAAKLTIPIQYVKLERDEWAAHQLNEGMLIAMNKDAEYIVRLEGDAIPLNRGWLRELVKVMENDKTIAIAMPFDINRKGGIGYGGRLYGNGTYCAITPPKILKKFPVSVREDTVLSPENPILKSCLERALNLTGIHFIFLLRI